MSGILAIVSSPLRRLSWWVFGRRHSEYAAILSWYATRGVEGLDPNTARWLLVEAAVYVRWSGIPVEIPELLLALGTTRRSVKYLDDAQARYRLLTLCKVVERAKK